MGNCTNSPRDLRPSVKDEKLNLYGDFLNQDTRALYILLKDSKVDFEFNVVNTLKEENLEAWFERINPSNQIPVITRSSNGETEKVIGG